MTEDEDHEIVAALAKLAGQDAAAADDARAALEWIAGEQDLAFITQARIQNFCWYDLPVKWFVDLDEKVRITAALAQVLDLLQLPRYAAICRSQETREILAAYETGAARGKAAFRRAATASGIMPPDLPDFQWGAAMGLEEASAWSSTAEFLEVAVAGGDLVPGRRGWKTRQQELTRAHLDTPLPDLLGQTLAQVILTERTETWVSRRRSETRRRIIAPLANRLLHPAELPAATSADPLPRLCWLLDQLDGGIALTQTGNLSRAFVQHNAGRFGWDFSSPPRTEDELFDLHQLRHLAQDLGLARRSGRTLTLTAKGRRLRADPGGLWRAVAAGLLGDDDFPAFAGELFLALLLDAQEVPGRQINAAVGLAAAEEGFRDSRTGKPPDEHGISWAVHATSNLCRALGLLAVGAGWSDRSCGLTGTGQATALEALRARATGPEPSPGPEHPAQQAFRRWSLSHRKTQRRRRHRPDHQPERSFPVQLAGHQTPNLDAHLPPEPTSRITLPACPSSAPLRYHYGMAMTLRLPPEIEDQLKQVAEVEHRSVQQTVLVAIEEYLSMRETAEILADPSALRGLAEARESEQSGDVVYGAEAARALLAERKR